MLKMKIVLQILFAMAAVLASSVTVASTTAPTKKNTIVDIALKTPKLSTLVKALKAGDLVETLEGSGPFTVFAPTNAAFEALPAGVLAKLLTNKVALDKILLYHVLGSEVQSDELVNGSKVQTLEKDYVTVTVDGKDIHINAAKVVIADIEASNGVIHVIDAVLSPAPTPTINLTIADYIKTTKTLTKLFDALSNFKNIVNKLNNIKGNFTLIAPVNSAFGNTTATKDILKYHVIDYAGQAYTLYEGVNYKNSLYNNQIVKIVETAITREIQFGYPTKTATVTKTQKLLNGDVFFVDMILEPPAPSAVVEKAASLEKFGAITNYSKKVTIFAVEDTIYDTNGVGGFGKAAKTALSEYSAVLGSISSGIGGIPIGTTIVSSLYEDGNLTIVKDKDGAITVNKIKVIKADILTDVSVIHVLESPLVVPWSSKKTMAYNIGNIGNYSELLKAVGAYPKSGVLDLLLSNKTKVLFAPSKEALLKANASNLDNTTLTNILLYHVLSGKHNATELSQKVHWESELTDSRLGKGAKQVVIVKGAGDKQEVNAQVSINGVLESTDGFVYNIGEILVIPGSIEDQIRNIDQRSKEESGRLTTFTMLLNRTNLTSVLLGLSHTTIFAPDNDAFKAYFSAKSIDPATIDGEKVKTLLLEHVFPDQALYSNDLFKLTNLTMNKKTWDIDSKSQTIGGAPIKSADNLVTNGVIHVIKRVLGAPPPASPATNDKSGITGGEIVGIVIGALAFIAIIGYCCFKSKKQKQDDYQHI